MSGEWSREMRRERSRSPAHYGDRDPYSRDRSNRDSYSRRTRSRSRSPRRYRRSFSRSPSYTPPSRRRPDRRDGWGDRRQYPTNVPPGRVLGVFGLSMYTSQRSIEDLMGQYGKLEKVDLIMDRLQTGRSRGFAFVYFDTVEDASRARSATNGARLDDRAIRVDFSLTKRAHTPTPGMYMGPRVSQSSSRYSRSRSRSPARYGYSRSGRSPSRSPRR